MYYNYRYRLKPSDAQREVLDRHRDLYRQAYNHFLHRLNRIDGTTVYDEMNQLPSIKEWWTDLSELYARSLQNVVKRLYDNLSSLKGKSKAGQKVGGLKWKSLNDFRSFTYSQHGFELKNTSGQTALRLGKIGEIPMHLHRYPPDSAAVKQVAVKKEPTGNWFAILGIETENEDTPPKPERPKNVVGIDVGIIKYAHDTDGHAFESPNFSEERDRLDRESRRLSRKEYGSSNHEKQRQVVASRYAEIARKRKDFLHKLSAYYAEEYDLVAVEDLDTKGLIELPPNSRNRAGAAWGTFLKMLEYKCEREGTHFVAVDPRGTTKECAACGVETKKPLWVREHSCPSCGYTTDRDYNAAWNILTRGIKQADIGVDHSESTPVETALPTGTHSVPAKRVVEPGSPALKEAASRLNAG